MKQGREKRIATVSAFSAESPVGSRGEAAESCARSDKPRLLAASEAPRNDKKIRVVEYVHTAEGLTPVEALGPEEREKFRRWMLCTWLNGLYVGKAVAYYRDGGTDSSTPLGMTEDGGGFLGSARNDGGAGYG